MVFVINYVGLESILALGQYRAKEILALLGFGVLSTFSCSAPQWQNLLVFEIKEPAIPGACRRKDPNEPNSQIPANCNKSRRFRRRGGGGGRSQGHEAAYIDVFIHLTLTAIMSAIWDNAVPWLEQVYRKDLSHLEVRMVVVVRGEGRHKGKRRGITTRIVVLDSMNSGP